MEHITFTNTFNISLEYREPVPSSRLLPNWFKETPPYINDSKKPDGKGNTTATVKKCMPVFDAITSGYIIPTYVDLYVSRLDNGDLKIEAPSTEPINFHPIQQAPLLPGADYQAQHIPKWVNPWGIKTPKGYSCLFIPPMHHPNQFFSVLPGVVDTDAYTAPVNFVFTFTDPNFSGLIPAGTPMVQVIPFKREPWKSTIDLSTDNIMNSERLMATKFYDRYKKLFWSKKEYK